MKHGFWEDSKINRSAEQNWTEFSFITLEVLYSPASHRKIKTEHTHIRHTHKDTLLHLS